MKTSVSVIVLLLSALVISGCQTAPLAMNYTPSSLVQGRGDVTVKEFRYLPTTSGKVAHDQIANTAIGTIHIGRPIGKYVADAFSSEFKYAGYAINKNKNTLSGEISEFMADDLGFSVDWTLKTKITLKDAAGKVVASKNVEIKKKLEKFGEFSVALNLIIKDAFEQMMTDQKFKSAIQ